MIKAIVWMGALVMLGGSFNGNQKIVSEHEPASDDAAGCYVIDTIASNLEVPWDIAFTPGGELLFTERPGRVRIIRNGVPDADPVFTVPGIEVRGKMGLLGLALHPLFNSNHYLYLAYNYRFNDKTWLRVSRYTYRDNTLKEPLVLIEQIPAAFNHTGCRLLFGKDRKLYISTGDADVPILAQDLKALNGKILRLDDDGGIPSDNPFVKVDSARKEIWSYGHRNSQGIAFQPGTGFLFDSEHGPTGGDEINAVTKGNNYGWPLVHHRDQKDGAISPLMEFSPSIGPAEAIFYSGRGFPSMKGNLLVACMRGEAIMRVIFNNGRISRYQYLLQKQHGRIRALTEGPDGSLYFSTSQIDPPESNLKTGEHDYDMILRMRPAKNGTPLEKPALVEAINNFRRPAISTGNHTTDLYMQLCASCHGNKLDGVGETRSLLGNNLQYGSTRTAISTSILKGITDKGMPAWQGVLTNKESDDLANYIINRRTASPSLPGVQR